MASFLLVGFWSICTILIHIAFLLKLYSTKLPPFFNELFTYGKVKNSMKSTTFVKIIDVPKRWFTWFYLVGIVSNGFATVILYRAYAYGHDPPIWYNNIITNFQSTESIDGFTAFIAILLMFIQNCRRFVECIFVSIYSKATMNIIHFFLGFSLYSTWQLAVLSEAPILKKQINFIGINEFLSFRPQFIIAIILFIFASILQNYSHRLFANLRTDKAGRVTSEKHVLPSGDLFEYVSNPHYFAEILIYLAFILLLNFKNLACLSICIFVWDNQIVAGALNHYWYKKKFDNFPPKRKAVIPFIY